mgnify:CR=1 FL=1
MFRKNSQTITGQLPEKRTNNFLFQPTDGTSVCSRFIKGSRSLITAFMVLALFFSISSCDNEGIVGGNLTEGEEQIESTTIPVTDLSIVSDNGFAGQLSYSAMGVVNDPAYGTINSSTLLKPSISQSEIESLPDSLSLKLVLALSSEKYGDTTSTSQYELYEINERWRGREIQYNNPVSVNRGNLIGSFQLADEDTLVVSLSEMYNERFRSFFNDTTAQRDSTYRFEFPGFALVPAEQNSKIDFVRYQQAIAGEQAADDTTDVPFTRFIVTTPEDSTVATLPVLDHGNSMTRTDEPATSDGLILHNTMENILNINFDIDPDDFRGKEIVNAQLIFNSDSGPREMAPLNFGRLDNEFLRGHNFETEPLSLHSEIFARQAVVGADIDDEEDIYRINLTQYIIDLIYGEDEATPLYITNQGNNGQYISTTLKGPDAAESERPRLIITTINPDNE